VVGCVTMAGRGVQVLGIVVVLLVACCGLSCVKKGKTTMGKEFFSHRLDTLEGLEITAGTAEIVEDQGGRVLQLDGLVLVPGLELADAGIEVEVCAPAPCYPGIAFRFRDLNAFELAYAVPAVSGQSDAIQYDPIFNGSNTWQLHTGPAYQKQAIVPTGEWFTLRIDVEGERAAIQIGDQPPLVVACLSHGTSAGRIGIWTYRPARFRNLRVTAPRSFEGLCGEKPLAPDGAIDAWWLEGTGTVACEPSGVLNLNRYKAAPDTEARLVRRFTLEGDTDLEIAFGYSDEIALGLDGEVLFTGVHTFSGFESEEARGWVRPASNHLIRHATAGTHRLEATLRTTEPFGWGLIVILRGDGIHRDGFEYQDKNE
jgi:hypothetical protein